MQILILGHCNAREMQIKCKNLHHCKANRRFVKAIHESKQNPYFVILSEALVRSEESKAHESKIQIHAMLKI